ncbi:HlyD family secretion protein [Echinimonas agarilytica]|uniref:HlyD family secretion protein n=1 Tax=Echinimonas agarilytica TaxID=1215918 RepID=A0AA41W3R6_9GAMM|nr:HlyD family secretion protein [Echinimonas agarilytica]MCM2678093.1 HlyD family secretion protein [Echinimonas agarilytica]
MSEIKTEEVPEKAPQEDKKKPEALLRISKFLLGLCIFFFLLYLIMDRHAPSTDLARVKLYITPITPEVSGHVTQIHVDVNQLIQPGETIFSIDQTDYLVAVAKAQENLRLAGTTVGAQTADIGVAQSRVADAKTQLETTRIQANRIFNMAGKGVVSQADADDARAKLDAAEARVITSEADLVKAQQTLGAQGMDNSQIKAAMLELENAELDLARTQITAPSLGTLANLTIEAGYYAQAGKPLTSYLNVENVWVEAYMRENNLEHIAVGDRVAMVLDNAPGRVFTGTVSKSYWAVDFGDPTDPSQLAKSQNKKGWMRDAQRFPINITFDDPEISRGLKRHGGQVDVIVFTDDNFIINSLGHIWIRIVSILSYAR